MKKVLLALSFAVMVGLQALFAQTINITGKVTDAADGSVIPGVSVFVKGTTVGTVTRPDGTYTLSVPNDATTLVFSFVGMTSQEIVIAGKTTINVVLQSDAVDVEEVVVTAIGIKRSEKSIGSAFTKVSQDQLVQKAESDVLRTMEGKVPGVNIASTGGAAGGATTITIRGMSSLSGDNQPLIVVDGIPYSNQNYSTSSLSTGGGAYGNALATIDPNDIESMNVLKGASASALYGSRAANGVIVITTKSGSRHETKGKFDVTLNSSYTWEEIASLPDYQNTYGNGSNFIYSNANGSWGPRFDSMEEIDIWDGYEDYVGILPGIDSDRVPYIAQPDNVKSLFNVGYLFDNSLSIRKGNDISGFNMTVSNSSNEGYIPFAEFDRFSFAVGGYADLTNGLRVNGNVSFSQTKQISGTFGNNQSSSDGGGGSGFARSLWLGRTWNMSLPYEDPITGFPISTSPSQYDHPLWSWKHNKITTKQRRSVVNVGLEYDITSWLTASYRLGYNNLETWRQEIVDLGSRKYDQKGAISQDMITFNEVESNAMLTASKRFADRWTLDAVIGHQVNQRQQERHAIQGQNIVSPGIYNLANTEKLIILGSNSYKRRLIGVYATATVGYNDMVYLTAKGRNDWSSTLAPGNNSYFYPALEGSVLFSNMLEIDESILSYGKLRASWGKTGNDAGVYSLYPYFDIKTDSYYASGAYPFLGQSTYSLPNTANNIDLKPEFSQDFELGTELKFLNNRVGLDFTYYNKKTTDLITSIQTPPSSGFTRKMANIGEVVNKGVEIILDATPVKYNGFSWDVVYTFTKNDNEVTKLFESGEEDQVVLSPLFGDPSVVAKVGAPIGSFLGEVPLKDDDGNLLIDPASGMPLIAEDPEVIGDPWHDFEMGLTNTFKFKGISLSAHLTYKKGGEIYSNSITSLLGRGVTLDTEDREKTVIVPGYYGDATTGLPIMDGTSKVPNVTQVQVNDLYFQSGDVTSFAINSVGYYQLYDRTIWRLNEVTLGYELPKSLLNRTPFGSIYLGFVGRNLWYLAPNVPEHTNFDPDMSTYGGGNIQGIEYSGAPSVKRYGFNLKVTF